MPDYQQTIPQLSEQIEFHPFDSKTYLVKNVSLGYQLRVSQSIMQILELVDGVRSIEDIASQISYQLNAAISSQFVFNTLYSGKLSTCGIVQSAAAVLPKKSEAYIWVSFTVLKAERIKGVCNFLAPLFKEKVFYILFIASLTYLVATIYANTDFQSLLHQTIKPQDIIYFYLVLVSSMLVHELGHAAACRQFDAEHGSIGIGMYLLMPVFFADVSDAWKVSKYKRFVIDLAGIYMELLFYTVVSVVFHVSGEVVVLQIILLRLISTTANLNPFLRFDGYWALCDLTNEPNLRQNSFTLFNKTLVWMYNNSTSPLNNIRDYLLVIYAFISWFSIIGFLISVLLYNPKSVITMPYNLYIIIHQIVFNWSSITLEKIQLALLELAFPSLFYYLLYKLISRWVSNKWTSLKSNIPVVNSF